MAAFMEAGLPSERVLALSIFADDQRYSNVPKKWREQIRPRFGGQLENIITLKPDWVVLSSYSRLDYQEILKKAGIKILWIDAATTLTDIQNNILKLGDAIGRTDLAMALNQGMSTQIESFKDKCNREKHPSVAILQFYPENGSVSGLNSTLTELAELACSRNHALTLNIKDWPKLSLERLMSIKPDYLLLACDAGKKAGLMSDLQRHDQWSKIPAVREKRLLFVDDRYLSSQSHYILQAVPRLRHELWQL